jgi:Protein of unknown function (DUF2946)
MRRQLRKFLPVFLIALAVQLLAPVASSWTAAIAASNPLGTAEICFHNSSQTDGSGDQGADRRTYHSLCSICCAAQVSAALDTPNHLTVAVLHRQPARVVWRIGVPDWVSARSGSNAQARAPPLFLTA